jgi:hypothetical protein
MQILFVRRPSAHLKSNPKFHGLDLSAMILPAKALRGTILNTRDRDQWLSGRFAFSCLDCFLSVAKLPLPYRKERGRERESL